MRKWIILLVILLALPAMALVGFYLTYGKMESRLRANHGFSQMQANAIKHAYASYTVYDLLKKAGASDETAEMAVFRLGIFNEWLEKTVHGTGGDSRSEVMRDLHNNWAGMSAAQWRWYQEQPLKRSGLSLIKALLNAQTLLVERPVTSYETSDGPDYSVAKSWLLPRRGVIRDHTQDALEKLILVNPIK